ncbi:hypothetical protein [Pseudoalteromonas sp. H71]|uniref:hypothetical protein n=1 Tax=Pseudoalteromonas sp. H71 TaxID=1348395 RepID=UPI000730D28A|nr:hypothetical protein [Pseudoalteromonas sp. H71]KTD97025.1 hypothetical protein ATS71_15790 [Pseudoalteromonas sp. H71]
MSEISRTYFKKVVRCIGEALKNRADSSSSALTFKSAKRFGHEKLLKTLSRTFQFGSWTNCASHKLEYQLPELFDLRQFSEEISSCVENIPNTPDSLALELLHEAAISKQNQKVNVDITKVYFIHQEQVCGSEKLGKVDFYESLPDDTDGAELIACSKIYARFNTFTSERLNRLIAACFTYPNFLHIRLNNISYFFGIKSSKKDLKLSNALEVATQIELDVGSFFKLLNLNKKYGCDGRFEIIHTDFLDASISHILHFTNAFDSAAIRPELRIEFSDDAMVVSSEIPAKAFSEFDDSNIVINSIRVGYKKNFCMTIKDANHFVSVLQTSKSQHLNQIQLKPFLDDLDEILQYLFIYLCSKKLFIDLAVIDVVEREAGGKILRKNKIKTNVMGWV